MTASITAIPFSLSKKPDDRERKQLAVSMDPVLLTLHIIESLELLSSSVVAAAHKGESYEVLTRQLETLHQDFQEVAQLACRAKYCTMVSEEY